MINVNVQTLIEECINSRTKLQLLLLFYEHPHMQASPRAIAQRCCRDKWSVSTALNEFADEGILVKGRSVGGEDIFYYAPSVDYCETIPKLVLCYDDPIKREEVFKIISEVSDFTYLHTDFDRQPF